MTAPGDSVPTPAEIERLAAEATRAAAAAREARIRLIMAQGVAFGADGVRDPDAPCESFRSGAPGSRIGRIGRCETDGHYLCDECVERATCPGGCGKRPSHCECPDNGRDAMWSRNVRAVTP